MHETSIVKILISYYKKNTYQLLCLQLTPSFELAVRVNWITIMTITIKYN